MTAPDIDSFATYGGHKNNYADVEDPTTDRSAPDVNAALCTVAAQSRTTPRAWARVVLAASTGAMAFAVTNPCDGQWPNILGNKPTLSRTGTGDFLLTYPTTLLDEDGVSHTLNFRGARASFEGATPGFVNAEAPTPNTVRVRTFNSGGSANDMVGITCLIEIF